MVGGIHAILLRPVFQRRKVRRDQHADTNFCLSPITAACPITVFAFNLFSIGCGATNLPPLVFSSSFLRSVMLRNPSSILPMSPVLNQPSSVNCFLRRLLVMPVPDEHRRPLHLQLSIGRYASLHVRHHLAHCANAVRLKCVASNHRRRLRHPIALKHADPHVQQTTPPNPCPSGAPPAMNTRDRPPNASRIFEYISLFASFHPSAARCLATQQLLAIGPSSRQRPVHASAS